MAGRERPKYNQMEEALFRSVKENKKLLDPNYSGDNPKTPDELKADLASMQEQARERDQSASPSLVNDPEKRRQAIARGRDKVTVLEPEKFKPARESGLSYEEHKKAADQWPEENKADDALADKLAAAIETTLRPDLAQKEEALLDQLQQAWDGLDDAASQEQIDAAREKVENFYNQAVEIFGPEDQPKYSDADAKGIADNIWTTFRNFQPEYKKSLSEAQERLAQPAASKKKKKEKTEREKILQRLQISRDELRNNPTLLEDAEEQLTRELAREELSRRQSQAAPEEKAERPPEKTEREKDEEMITEEWERMTAKFLSENGFQGQDFDDLMRIYRKSDLPKFIEAVIKRSEE